MTTNNFEMEDYIKCVNEFKFERFLDLQKKWLKNLRVEWLIMGHLTE